MDVIFAPQREKPRKPARAKVRLSWSSRLAYLESELAIREMPSRRRRDLVNECKAARRKYMGAVCSVTWFEDVWKSTVPEYPPKAENTPMKRCKCEACRRAKKYWPGSYVGSSGKAFECFVESLPEWRAKLIPSSGGSVILWNTI